MTDDTQFRLSRRKVLAGLGTIGIASAGAGLGTTAFLSDEESVSAELQAGRLDLLVDYRATYNPWLSLEDIQSRKGELLAGNTFAAIDGEDYADGGGPVVIGQSPDLRTDTGEAIPGTAWAKLTKDGIDACTVEDFGDVRGQLSNMASPYDTYQVYDDTDEDYLGVAGQPYVDGPDGVMFRLTDVKPKDEGEATISLHLCDNPGYIFLTTTNEIDAENGVVEPESSAGDSDDDTDASGELANYVHVRSWPDADCSNTLNGDEEPAYEGSLAGFVDRFGDRTRLLSGDLDGGCFSAGVHCIAFEWYVICEPEDFDLPSDVDGSGGTIGGELDAAGLPRDVNVIQTDGVEFGLVFDAVQCRHNMLGPDEQSFDTLVMERDLDPKATYLHTNSDPGATGAVPIDLGANGLAPGDTIRIDQVGAFKPGNGTTHTDSNVKTIAVFSSSPTLDGSSQSHRVPGAIDAGVDFASADTWYGSETTDIPEDFRVDPSVVVTVPAGATHLFVAAHDSHYGDNTDPNGDYGIAIYT